MPQMAPINWLMLFIIFSIAFIIFNVMNYYSFIPTMPKSNLLIKTQSINSLNWKW
uniref:ATP synthase complex subunit 8 n=1 Tax=Sarcophaga josephi TaxID=411858 RepID=A0A7M3V7J0_9MUSC|nr:ATP synthase F0 subunit 8 [Sarcophaga josephi]QOP39440.1 ATP synthase F0 subunit 8 [Sarcophaga josephi]